MDEVMGTGDIIIGVLAALGVVVLIGVVVYVLKTIILKKDDETDEHS
jgi:hypothetical protein